MCIKSSHQTNSVIYLEEIYGWVTAAKSIDEWRYLLALRICVCFEMNHGNTCKHVSRFLKGLYYKNGLYDMKTVNLTQ